METLIASILTSPKFYLFIGIVAVFIFLICVIADFFKEPFQYPRIKQTIDLSGRRQPSYEECIDEWLLSIDGHGRTVRDRFNRAFDIWDNGCKDYLEKTWFWKKHKLKIYNHMRCVVLASDYEMFKFEFVRSQTRYKQQNYQKYAYKVNNVENVWNLTLLQIMEIDDELEEIDYETTREKYYAKNQRRLMTKELRRKIIERDNYTCQMCGKYMPDEVGLHVDHIVPIKKGGKSVESNLQVLCDKCNLSKGKK